jgi:hypothetical protein
MKIKDLYVGKLVKISKEYLNLENSHGYVKEFIFGKDCTIPIIVYNNNFKCVEEPIQICYLNEIEE